MLKVFNNWDKTQPAKPNQRGLNRCICTIPGNLLAPGRYYITAQVCDSDNVCKVESPAPVSIDVYEEEYVNSVTSPQTHANCQIRPDLPWQIETLSENPPIAPQ